MSGASPTTEAAVAIVAPPSQHPQLARNVSLVSLPDFALPATSLEKQQHQAYLDVFYKSLPPPPPPSAALALTAGRAPTGPTAAAAAHPLSLPVVPSAQSPDPHRLSTAPQRHQPPPSVTRWRSGSFGSLGREMAIHHAQFVEQRSHPPQLPIQHSPRPLPLPHPQQQQLNNYQRDHNNYFNHSTAAGVAAAPAGMRRGQSLVSSAPNNRHHRHHDNTNNNNNTNNVPCTPHNNSHYNNNYHGKNSNNRHPSGNRSHHRGSYSSAGGGGADHRRYSDAVERALLRALTDELRKQLGNKRRQRSADSRASTVSSCRRSRTRAPYFSRPGPLLAAMANDYAAARCAAPQLSPMPQTPAPLVPRGWMGPWGGGPAALPAAMEQPGGAVATDVLSPVASRSMLTCSKEFRLQFPNVYAGLCKGLLDVNRLVQHEVVVPIREEIAIHKDAIRSRRAVTGILSEHLWRPLHGRFPDPSIAPKLIRRLADYFFDKIEQGIHAAEDERSFLQWLFRFDVENAMDIRVTTTLGVGMNSALANIEGVARCRRSKGSMLSILTPDSVQIDMDVVVKALFLNGGQLAEINDDPLFIDRVQAGENRFAATFINY